MAIDFRLSVNAGGEYTDLFPRTGMAGIKGTENVLKYSEIEVNIPAVTEGQNIQNIAITTTARQVDAPVYMMLLSTGEQAEKDYGTITQFAVMENQLTITRLYSWPTGEIKVKLLFEEKGLAG